LDNNGNILWFREKDFGMGAVHPIAWYKSVGQGRAFYTSIGHTAEAFKKSEIIDMLEQAIVWTTDH